MWLSTKPAELVPPITGGAICFCGSCSQVGITSLTGRRCFLRINAYLGVPVLGRHQRHIGLFQRFPLLPHWTPGVTYSAYVLCIAEWSFMAQIVKER